jgi:hypothetical protein
MRQFSPNDLRRGARQGAREVAELTRCRTGIREQALERDHSGNPRKDRQDSAKRDACCDVPGMHRCAEPREPFQNAPIRPFSSSFRRTPLVYKAMQRKAAVRIGLPKPSSKPSLKRSIEFASKNAQTTFQIQAIATNRENDPVIQHESGCSLTRKAAGSGSECATRRR